MAHLFICPNCGHRSTATERTAGFRNTPKGCSKCGFGFLFELLEAIVHKFAGGPVGLSTLAVSLGEESDTIEDVYEPYLLQRGFLVRTPRGRCATRHAYAHLGVAPPAHGASLF